MTTNAHFNENAPFNEMGDILNRVRQVDATSDEAAVRGYVREMAEAGAVLDTVDVGDTPFLVSFSASWIEVSAR